MNRRIEVDPLLFPKTSQGWQAVEKMVNAMVNPKKQIKLNYPDPYRVTMPKKEIA